jgi:hypothetical protein
MDYTFQNFQPHVGSAFQILVNDQPALDLTLVEVEDLTVNDRLRDPAIRSQPFSLIFHGPHDPVAGQANYRLNHSELGRLEIFLVPLGPHRRTPQTMQYQAIFN